MKGDDLLAEGSKVEQEYSEGKQYHTRMGFATKWPEYERFKASDQWPAPTKRTQNLPRPVFNIIKYIENHKVSSVMNENVRMLYRAQEMSLEFDTPEDRMKAEVAEKAADSFTRYSDTTWENIKQDELNEEALEVASNVGTGIWHYFWNTDKQGGSISPYVGDMEGEVLDPINVFLGNPQKRNIQKQPYILISSREMVDTVRKEAKANEIPPHLIELIKSDNETRSEGYDRAQVELTSSNKVTVLTKYWRENGLIYFAKYSCGVPIKRKTSTGMKLYPIAWMQWERRRKSAYGIGDTEGLIPNQKAINVMMAMQILSTQLTGWPKLIYKTNAIDPNKVTNTPGEMIEDKSPPGTGDGVKYLAPASTNTMAMNLVDSFIDYTKTLSSAQDAATGDVSRGQT
ncbi:hypothetical protein [Paenibacillus sp. 1P03SA]|uniref:hypothetical protein n=1 Tax=Paenibacillus sp. 1P03SA TaxID=3132294 RepID=UPI0039A1142F